MQIAPVGIGIVGCGRIARAHLAAISRDPDHWRLACLVESDPARARELLDQYPGIPVAGELSAIPREAGVQALVICLPNHLHGPIGLEAIEAGLHVLIEKPIARTTAEVDHLIDAGRRRRVVVMAGQNRRYYRAMLAAKEAMGEIGEPFSLIHLFGVYFPNPPTSWWRSAENVGGLAIGMNGPHAVDAALWLLAGSRPTRVYAQATHTNPHWEGEDEATISVAFDSGALATVHLSFNTRPPVNERYVIGSRGSMRIDGDVELVVNGQPRVQAESGNYTAGEDLSFDRQLVEFWRAVTGGCEPMASAAEVRSVVEVLDAARMSLQCGNPVELK